MSLGTIKVLFYVANQDFGFPNQPPEVASKASA